MEEREIEKEATGILSKALGIELPDPGSLLLEIYRDVRDELSSLCIDGILQFGSFALLDPAKIDLVVQRLGTAFLEHLRFDESQANKRIQAAFPALKDGLDSLLSPKADVVDDDTKTD